MSNKEYNEDDTVWYWDVLGRRDPATVLKVYENCTYFIRIDRSVWGGTSCITVKKSQLSSRAPHQPDWIEQVVSNMEV